jgi:hypothetical protein
LTISVWRIFQLLRKKVKRLFSLANSANGVSAIESAEPDLSGQPAHDATSCKARGLASPSQMALLALLQCVRFPGNAGG